MRQKFIAQSFFVLVLLVVVEVVFQINTKFKIFNFSLRYDPVMVVGDGEDVHFKNVKKVFDQSKYAKWRHRISFVDIGNDERNALLSLKTNGKFFEPSSTLQSQKGIVDASGKVSDIIYDVKYTFDSQGRRIVPHVQSEKLPSYVFLGCSFTFGEGLQDDETFSYHFSNLRKNISVINYGSPGYGPNDILRELEQASPRSSIKDRMVDTVVYTMIEDHIDRVNCSYYYCLKPGHQERRKAPMYKMINNKLTYAGLFKDVFPWSEDWLSLFDKSAFLNTFGILAPQRTPSEIALTVQVIKELEGHVRRQWKARRFVVSLFPFYWDQSVIKELKKELSAQGVEWRDFSKVPRLDKNYDFLLPIDEHPSPAGSYMYALLLDDAL